MFKLCKIERIDRSNVPIYLDDTNANTNRQRSVRDKENNTSTLISANRKMHSNVSLLWYVALYTPTFQLRVLVREPIPVFEFQLIWSWRCW